MKKILNPYQGMPGYNCFGCSPDNAVGLKMEFYEEDDYIGCDWMPADPYQGYKGVLHGGIQQTLMDEIASWVVQVKLKTAGVTSRMETRFVRPVSLDAGPIHLKARLSSLKKKFAGIDVELYNNSRVLCAKAFVTYFTVDEEEAREKFFYPGAGSFYKTQASI